MGRAGVFADPPAPSNRDPPSNTGSAHSSARPVATSGHTAARGHQGNSDSNIAHAPAQLDGGAQRGREFSVPRVAALLPPAAPAAQAPAHPVPCAPETGHAGRPQSALEAASASRWLPEAGARMCSWPYTQREQLLRCSATSLAFKH